MVNNRLSRRRPRNLSNINGETPNISKDPHYKEINWGKEYMIFILINIILPDKVVNFGERKLIFFSLGHQTILKDAVNLNIFLKIIGI